MVQIEVFLLSEDRFDGNMFVSKSTTYPKAVANYIDRVLGDDTIVTETSTGAVVLSNNTVLSLSKISKHRTGRDHVILKS